MTVHLRVKGWLKPGAVVPVSVEAMADLVTEARRLEAENGRLSAHSAALRALLDAITKHGPDSEQVNDAYRDAVIALKVE